MGEVSSLADTSVSASRDTSIHSRILSSTTMVRGEAVVLRLLSLKLEAVMNIFKMEVGCQGIMKIERGCFGCLKHGKRLLWTI